MADQVAEVKPYHFREWVIPAHMVESLQAYVIVGRPVGAFLEAVLSNNFTGACRTADDENLRNLPAYAAYVYNEMPFAAQGSPEKVVAWMEQGGLNATVKSAANLAT